MKCYYSFIKFIILILSIFSLQHLYAQEIFIPPLAEGQSIENQTQGIYENNGQLIDTDENPATNIRYYTSNTDPVLYFFDDKVSYVQSLLESSPNKLDTIYRLDMFPSRTTTDTEPIAVEPTDDYLNYYLAHCPNGITNVQGYRRIVYPNYYEGIDLHYFRQYQFYFYDVCCAS